MWAGANVASPLGMLFASNSLGNSFMAFNTNYHDTGLFGVYASTPKGAPSLVWQCHSAVIAMLHDMQTQPFLSVHTLVSCEAGVQD